MAGKGNIERRITNPTGKGGFVKGQSGNPGGRCPSAEKVFSNLAIASRKYAKMALGNLVKLANQAESEQVRLQANLAILDRGYGRPTQSIDLKTDSPVVQLNLFDGIPLEDQRLIAETIEQIEHDPSGMRNVIDLVAEPVPAEGSSS